jgi:hypothetical protein
MPKVSHKSIEEQNLFANIHLINISIFRKALQIYYNIHVKSFFLDQRKWLLILTNMLFGFESPRRNLPI